MNYILSEYVNKNNRNAFNATNKARSDTIKIATSIGYKHIPLFHCGDSKLKIVIELIFNSIKTSLMAKKNDNVMIQYPYSPSIVNSVLFAILNFGHLIKGFNIQVIVHDIVFMRTEDNYEKSMIENVDKEFKRFRYTNKIIIHNKKMYEILSSNKTLKKNGVVLGVFYYLYDKEIKKQSYSDFPHIIIAGNLDKNKTAYIYKLKNLKSLKFNLYGVGFEDNDSDNLFYQGKFQPDELIENLKGNFGLVWDGDSIDTCTGVFGNYLKYNNPHKLSLYLAAGIPVIVWKRSALASFVTDNGIGFSVNSLREIEGIFEKMGAEKYNKMIDSVYKVREKLVSGENLIELLQ